MSAADEGGNRTLGQLVATATTELSALVHDEIALAKAELRDGAKRAAIGSSAGIVAGVLVLFSLPVLSFALAYGFHAWTDLHLGWCFLIVGVLYWLLAGALGGLAYAKIRKVRPPRKSIREAKETAAVLGNVKPHPRAALNGGPAPRDVTRSSA
ncbi:phage holin family protein [Streptomyces sp. B1866]|uniref:phage holin family protein n=1 Tax=Streptomyces sp. B1866 TaxID=3075431 RepID=UPI002890E054|nr:phage holin family protein [Streptomyces sp. B1866]MDT3395155.1 phage holin family protein [Streptomyces sp. B1866]